MRQALRKLLRVMVVVAFCVLVSGSAPPWKGHAGLGLAWAGETAPLPGLPEAPYVFMGDVAHLTQAGFETVQDYAIGDAAVLNVHDGAGA
ncbi:MAG TPA: hypothetical protein DIS96_09685, partial [Pusillimonas sp.]|nr:hypothetical protein [Pusillimonas sp.]